MSDECLFCRIASGDVPADVVYEDNLVVAFRDITPQAPVHILVIPREHLADVTELEKGNPLLAMRLFRVAAELAAKEGLDSKGFRIVVNTGQTAGQTVRHLHLHLLGGRDFAWPPG